MVAGGLREETISISTTNPAVSFLVLLPLGPLSLDSTAVQTRNCTLSADRNGSKKSLLVFGLKSSKGGRGSSGFFPPFLGPCPHAIQK